MGDQHDPDRSRSGLTDRGYDGLKDSASFTDDFNRSELGKEWDDSAVEWPKAPFDESLSGTFNTVGDHRDNPEDDFLNDTL